MKTKQFLWKEFMHKYWLTAKRTKPALENSYSLTDQLDIT